ncbi:MAG: hypothetical protein CM1200mP36_10120 [Gammaproteobacteria bacterium]|nr:MAG: hypothetical protein CM1200mP36_10120 [Gammaproteobacteria bacterium]
MRLRSTRNFERLVPVFPAENVDVIGQPAVGRGRSGDIPRHPCWMLSRVGLLLLVGTGSVIPPWWSANRPLKGRAHAFVFRLMVGSPVCTRASTGGNRAHVNPVRDRPGIHPGGAALSAFDPLGLVANATGILLGLCLSLLVLPDGAARRASLRFMTDTGFCDARP